MRVAVAPCLVSLVAVAVLQLTLWRGHIADKITYTLLLVPALSVSLLQAYNYELLRRQTYAKEGLFQHKQRQLEREHANYDNLLNSIMPKEIANMLKHRTSGDLIARNHACVTVLFITVDGLYEGAASQPTNKMLHTLAHIFRKLEESCNSLNIEKIKTTGSCFMAVSGLYSAEDHAKCALSFALAAPKAIQRAATVFGMPTLSYRIGISSGPVTSGVIGTEKPKFDVFGDTVNVSARMYQTAPPDTIQLSAATALLVESSGFEIEESDNEVFVKGKGLTHTWFLLGDGSSYNTIEEISLADPTTGEEQRTHSGSAEEPTQGEEAREITEHDFDDLSDLVVEAAPVNIATLQFQDLKMEEAFLDDCYFAAHHGYFASGVALGALAQLGGGAFLNAESVIFHHRGWMPVVTTCILPFFFFLLSLTPIPRKWPKLFHSLLTAEYAAIVVLCITYYNTGVMTDSFPQGILGVLVLLHATSCVLFPVATLTSLITLTVFSLWMISGSWHSWNARVLVTVLIVAQGVVSHYITERQLRRTFALGECLVSKRSELLKEEEASKHLLLSLMPPSLVEQLHTITDVVLSASVKKASVLVTDIVGFTALCNVTPPPEIVLLLDRLFSLVDELMYEQARGVLQKLKTLGDCYVAVCFGESTCFSPNCTPTHAWQTVLLGLRLTRGLRTLNLELARAGLPTIKMRVGVHSGPVVVGVMRMRRITYDCWGPTVEIADLLQASGDVGALHISQDTYAELLAHPLAGTEHVHCKPAPDLRVGGHAGDLKTFTVMVSPTKEGGEVPFPCGVK
eukprot:TRINITY_DN5352_c0_g1_i3.p1 TRINITY_DN5352_c0_g1~~TRINITY_DN5352_c0_g1_i3.p1  ORF type:complete len:797 (-),score=206.81 TRINITY_DN5352_c0_g1_i3:49-2439(-)